MSENWRDIKDYEGLYQVSDQGRVRSLHYRHSNSTRILKSSIHTLGYQRLALVKDGSVKFYYVHSLVWEAFNGPVPEGMQINHNDEVKTNNNLENLSLMTPKDNSNWGTRNERVGKAHRKMVEQHTFDGTHICTWFSIIGIEREFGYKSASISGCCNGRYKTAYGYKWKYAE